MTADPVKANVRMALALSVRIPRRERIVVTWFGRTGHLDGPIVVSGQLTE